MRRNIGNILCRPERQVAVVKLDLGRGATYLWRHHMLICDMQIQVSTSLQVDSISPAALASAPPGLFIVDPASTVCSRSGSRSGMNHVYMVIWIERACMLDLLWT